MVSDAVEIARTRELIRSGRAKEIRERAGLSRGEIARSLDVDPSAVGRWEDGKRIPRGDAAQRYGRLLRGLAEVGL